MKEQIRWWPTVVVAMAWAFLQPQPVSAYPHLWAVSSEYQTIPGASAYTYRVKNLSTVPLPLHEFAIGTDDPSAGHYTQVRFPADYQFTVGLNDMATHTTTILTAPGDICPGGEWVRPTRATARWTNIGDPSMVRPGESLMFTFTNVYPGQDAEWLVTGPGTQRANPAMPLLGLGESFGAGPATAPTPEPATLAAMGTGLMLVSRPRRRHK